MKEAKIRQLQYKDSKIARDIKIISEVEKIWILFDKENNGELDYSEIKQYLQEVAYTHLSLTDKDIKNTFDFIDKDKRGTIDKHEMKEFIDKLQSLEQKIAEQKKQDSDAADALEKVVNNAYSKVKLAEKY